MPKKKKAHQRGAVSSTPRAPTNEPPDPFAGLAARAQRAGSPMVPRADFTAALERMKVENLRLDEAKALLRTAADLLRHGRDADARDPVTEALRLAPTDHGEINCAGMAAQMMIGDEIETQAAAAVDEHDTGWIERVLALVPRFTGPEADDIRLAASSVNDYRLSGSEQERVLGSRSRPQRPEPAGDRCGHIAAGRGAAVPPSRIDRTRGRSFGRFPTVSASRTSCWKS